MCLKIWNYWQLDWISKENNEQKQLNQQEFQLVCPPSGMLREEVEILYRKLFLNIYTNGNLLIPRRKTWTV